MRFIVIGLGAVGGTVAALLHRAGQEVVGVARGAHLDVVRRDGLTLATPRESFVAKFGAHAAIADIAPRDGDVVMLAVKTQHSAEILDAVGDAGFGGAAIVCLQNGVENERLALRRFGRVYGVCVVLPSAHDTPGLVEDFGDPHPGILDCGLWPHRADATAEAIASALVEAGFHSNAVPDISRLKYGKLLMNLGNALEVCFGPGPHWLDHYLRVRAEAEGVLRAAGVSFAGAEEDQRRRSGFAIKPIEGKARQGGSTWQSVARASGSVETDYLNGEVALLARLHGLDAPLNVRLCALARAVAQGRYAPGAVPVTALTDGIG